MLLLSVSLPVVIEKKLGPLILLNGIGIVGLLIVLEQFRLKLTPQTLKWINYTLHLSIRLIIDVGIEV